MKKDEKSISPKSVAKGVTMAAMVAALGISLGTEVKSVYAQGNELIGGSRINLEGSLALKIDTGGSQEIKLTQSVSGKILSINGSQVTILVNNKPFTYSVRLQSGGNAAEYLKLHYNVGGSISGKLSNGQLVLMDITR